MAKQFDIDIEKPRYDQSTYWGRAKHFFITANPLNILKTPSQLNEAKEIVCDYRQGKHIEGLNEDKLWTAKQTYDSAYHPETGEKMFVIGRMSFQVPGNMLITGCMLQFYKTTPAVVFWQWINQTFNATVNYTNRSGDAPISMSRLATSYVLATSGAVSTALIINKQVASLPPIVGRCVPFVAVAAANCVNIPFMRSSELTNGIVIQDENGEKVGASKKTARKAIFQVVLSRIGMAVPGMLFPPVLMNYLEKRGVLAKYPAIGAPLQIMLCGIILVFSTPLCCAFFPQRSSVSLTSLEPELQSDIKKKYGGDNVPTTFYYNKGL